MRPASHTISPLCLSAESKWYVSFDVIEIGERIGEGQFGDVHMGVMTTKEGPREVAIKSCKMAETQEDKMKFVREAGRLYLKAHGLLVECWHKLQKFTARILILLIPPPALMKEFSHPHIIELFGWTMRDQDYFILMELAPYGEVGVELGCHGNCICTKHGCLLLLLFLEVVCCSTHHTTCVCCNLFFQLRNYLITHSGTITQMSLLMYVAQLGSAMAYLESMNYVHR